MDRLIDPAHPIHELHRRRWSPRAFDPHRLVEPEKLRSVMEAARWAPSSFNEQPWRFVVATREEPEAFARMLSCLVEQNQAWARHAPVLMIACASPVLSRNGKPNRHALYDLGQAVAFLTLEATALGLHLHQMAGFFPEKAREAFEIPQPFEAVSMIVMGYLGDPNSLPEDLRRRELTPTTRKPITDFVFAGRWGQRAGWART
jgi:nitroreductase